MDGHAGAAAEQEGFLLRITSVPATAATVWVRRLRTGATTHAVGLDEVPDAIWALLASDAARPAGVLVPGPAGAAPPGERTRHGVEPRVGVRLDAPEIRQGEPLTVDITLAVDAHAVSRPTARCAVSLFARPIVSCAPPADHDVDIGRAGMTPTPGRYRLETVVELTELREGHVRHLAVAFVESLLVVSPAHR